MTGRIHSAQTFGTLDGPGIRYVLFMQGCPLRCPYCHNPDTWDAAAGEEITPQEAARKVLRYKEYFGENGGITVSGGEPLLQADFVAELFGILKAEGIHTALDTSGCIINPSVLTLLDVTDLVLLDVKMTTDDDYRRYIGVSLGQVTSFLSLLEQRRIPTWIRQVIVSDFNDSEDNIRRLRAVTEPFSCITKTELLPFRKLCKEKYDDLAIPFPFDSFSETDNSTITRLTAALRG